MTSGWETKRLDDVCQFSNGLWKGKKPPFVKVGVIRNTNFTKEGTLDDSDIAYLDVEARKLEKRRLRYGDIILEKSGGGPKQPVGRVALFDKKDEDFSFSNFTAAIRVLHSHELDFRFLHKFLFWTYLSGVTEKMQSHSTGIRNLDGDAYKAISISFPSISEQKRIVSVLDKAFDGIATAKANAERNLQNARTLFENQLDLIFAKCGTGWVNKKLSELSEINYGYTESACAEQLGPKFLRITDIQDNHVDWNTVPYCPIGASEVPKYRLVDGDIVFARTGATTGKSYLIAEPPVAVFASYLIRVKLASKEILPPFLYLFFQTKSYWDSIRSGSSGSAQGGFNATKLGELVIPYPKLAKEQQIIIEKLNELSEVTVRLASLYRNKLANLEELKKSLLHQAFSGNL